MSTLRDYQQQQLAEISAAVAEGKRAILSVLPTGGGKTVCMGKIAGYFAGWRSMAVAHRKELVGQISIALARESIPHRIIAPDNIRALISQVHREELGCSYEHGSAPAAVASVDTLIRRGVPHAEQYRVGQIDEGHHVLRDNKWGRAFKMLPSATWVGWTATPTRTDKKKLGHEGDGVYDHMVVGPSARVLCERGFLAPVVIMAPPPSIDRERIEVSRSTGDFKPPALSESTRRSTIVGDVVAAYLRFTPGEPGVTFAADVWMAEQHASAFNHHGVPAAVVTDKTPAADRDRLVRELRAGVLKELVNVDIFGEGFDLPAISVVSMARASESFGLISQQIGRARRIAPGKPHGTIIDHVGNIVRHGFPDDVDGWTIEGDPVRKSGQRIIPVRQCTSADCWRAFQSYSTRCPHCGTIPAPVQARRPEQVEGDLILYGPELMEELRQKARAAIASPIDPWRTDDFGNMTTSGRDLAVAKNMAIRAAAQEELRSAMAWWAGVRMQIDGHDNSSAMRRFFGTFGIDAYSAHGLGAPEARRLMAEIWRDLGI